MRLLWAKQCDERGVTASGFTNAEAQLPRRLRKSRICTGLALRARGAGRKDKLEFLYPLVKELFEPIGLVGQYIDAEDLEGQLLM